MLLLEVQFVLPTVSREMVENHVLPVHGVTLFKLAVSDRWHLEWEKCLTRAHVRVIILFDFLAIAVVFIHPNDIVVTQKLSIESTYDHDFV